MNKSFLAIILMSFSAVLGNPTVSDNGYYVKSWYFEDEIAHINEQVEIDMESCFFIDGVLPPVVAPSHLGTIGVQYKDKKWHIFHGEEIHVLQNCDVDPMLRGIDEEVLAHFYASGCYVLIGQYTDGSFNLKAKVRGFGGGVSGWMIGAYTAKFVTHFVGHGTILVIAACTGPAAPATLVALEATFLPTIEAASTVAALAGGITVGVMTGPV